MIDATLRPVIAAWVSAITGIAPALVLWVDQPRPFTPSAYALLEITSSTMVGYDETVFDHDAVDPDLDVDGVPADLLPAQTGMRHLVLQLAVESDNLGDADVAHVYLERARRRMRWSTHLATLHAARLAIVTSVGPTAANYRSEDRAVSRAVLDVTLAHALDERLGVTPDRDAGIPYIGTVGVTSLVSDVDGNQVGTPPQFADVEMP